MQKIKFEITVNMPDALPQEKIRLGSRLTTELHNAVTNAFRDLGFYCESFDDERYSLTFTWVP